MQTRAPTPTTQILPSLRQVIYFGGLDKLGEPKEERCEDLSSHYALVVAVVWTYAAEDPQAGTWNLNVAKSKYSPGPATKSGTASLEAWGDDGVKVTADGVNADGQTTHVEFQAKYDGKDYPITGVPTPTPFYSSV